MSNKTQLQTNNTALDALITRVNAAKDTAASLPEAGGSGSNNSGEWINVESLPTTYIVAPPGSSIFYYEVPENCNAVMFNTPFTGACGIVYKGVATSPSFTTTSLGSNLIQDADGTGTVLEISTDGVDIGLYLLPIYGTWN